MESNIIEKKRKKRKNKSYYGENFVSPDGGYGWIICITSGLANLALFIVFQQFGLLYRDKLLNIGLTHSEITSIINVNTAVSSLSGFLNGPMFRRFSYRQVGIAGSLISTVAIYLTSISNTFESFLFTFGVLFAFGFGIATSANHLVFSVYFNKKRSMASCWKWTITGIGPIVFPYIVNYLIEIYGVSGTILIITGISAHSFAFSMTYQPVLWHTKTKKNTQTLKLLNKENNIIKKSEDDEIEEFKPMYTEVETNQPNEENDCKLPESEKRIDSIIPELKGELSLCHRFVNYFELNLLKDSIFLNIVIGLMLSLFVEINFTLLTPFFLKDFELENHQIAFLMSMPAIPDLACRFLIQFLIKKIKLDNRTYYLIGIFGTTISRAVIALKPSYIVMCAAFFCLGVCKAFRTVFYGIVIPDHVPLNSLPAALGISLLFDGIFPILCGSVIGLIRDVSNYQIALQFLNLLSMITVISWTVEYLFIYWRNKRISKEVLEKA